MAALSAPICCWSKIDFTGNTNQYSTTDLWQHCLHPSVAGLRLTSLATQIITVIQIYGSIVCTHLLRSWSKIDFTGNTDHYSNTDLWQHCLHPSVAELSKIDFTGNINHYSTTDLWQHCLHPSVAELV